MKKILATILALVMVLSLSVTALAVDKTENVTINSTSEGTVDISITDITETVYSVTVTWDSTSLEYFKNDGIWNPETHEYEPDEDAEEHELSRWISGSATVTVTNHSNAPVTATIAEQDITTGTDYSFSVNSEVKTTFDLATAVDTAVGEAPSNEFLITAETAPDVAGSDTFVVTISEYVEAPVYAYETIGASDSYWDSDLYMPDTITTNTLLSFWMSNYVYEFDGVTENDAYVNYEVKSVVCEANPDKLVTVTESGEEYYRFTEAGDYEVTVTFHDGYANTDTTKTLTFTVTA